MEGLMQLSRLTSLKVGGYWSALQQPLLQMLALALPLQQLHLYLGPFQLWGVRELKMTHLPALTEFAAPGWPGEMTMQFSTQLQNIQLGASYGNQLNMLLHLQQLQRLGIAVESKDKEPLLRLTRMPALQELALTYKAADEAAATAAVWRQLPQLRELSVQYDCHFVSDRQLAKIRAGVAAAPSLTELQLSASSEYHDDKGECCSSSDSDEDECVYSVGSLCRSLACLTLLGDLSIVVGLTAAQMPPGNWLAADDVRALTVLTGLTRLVLVHRDGCLQYQDEGSG
jgi:hypothetical protein